MFMYKMQCPVCAAFFQEYRDEPYKSVRRKKLCVSCKKGSAKKMAEEFKGIEKEDCCKNCKFFGTVSVDVPTNEWFKPCAKGRFSADDPGNLVYALDWCDEFESGGCDED